MNDSFLFVLEPNMKMWTYSIFLCVFLNCDVWKLGASIQKCEEAPHWLINGKNPILEETSNGKVVVLSLVPSKSKTFLTYTLRNLNNYGYYFK